MAEFVTESSERSMLGSFFRNGTVTVDFISIVVIGDSARLAVVLRVLC